MVHRCDLGSNVMGFELSCDPTVTAFVCNFLMLLLKSLKNIENHVVCWTDTCVVMGLMKDVGSVELSGVGMGKVLWHETFSMVS